jgi:glycosyltransferase involved in cell wall biosynthesis
MRIRFVGPLLNTNGYAEFGRYFIRAFHERGIEYLPFISATEHNEPDLGKWRDIIVNASNQGGNYDINIINLTPELAMPHFVKTVPNVVFTMFETTRIPKQWVEYCNTADAVFVPCQWNKEVFESSGIRVPVYVISPGVFTEDFQNRTVEHPLTVSESVRYKFYSIFQWTERKNPFGLLRGYYAQFTGCDDVMLVLKTYKSGFSAAEHTQLKEIIARIKQDMKLSHYPKVTLISKMLSSEQMADLHKQCDCFVLPHRAEGFGMPHMVAMGWGNPVVTTGFSGNMEFMSEDSSYLLPYQLTPVHGLPWVPWYEGTMDWAEPDIAAMKSYMWGIYKNPAKASKVGEAGQKYMYKALSWDLRMDNLLKAAEEICG